MKSVKHRFKFHVISVISLILILIIANEVPPANSITQRAVVENNRAPEVVILSENTSDPYAATWARFFSEFGISSLITSPENLTEYASSDNIIVIPRPLSQSLEALNISAPTLLLGESITLLVTSTSPLRITAPDALYIPSYARNLSIFRSPFDICGSKAHMHIVNPRSECVVANASDLLNNTTPPILIMKNSTLAASAVSLRGDVRVLWVGVEKPGDLSLEGKYFLINSLFWLREQTIIDLLAQSLAKLQLDQWHGRGGFPCLSEPDIVSTFYGWLCMETCGINSSLIDKNATVSWLLSLYHDDEGSFYQEPPAESKVLTTALVIMLLKMLGALDLVNKSKVACFLSSAYNSTSGKFAYETTIDRTMEVKATWAAIKALMILGEVNGTMAASVVSYIKRLQVSDESSEYYGAFLPKEGIPSFAYGYYAYRFFESSFLALDTLLTLSEVLGPEYVLDIVNLSATAEWLVDCYLLDELFNVTSYDTLYQNAYAVLCVERLRRFNDSKISEILDRIFLARVIDWIMERQTEIGGFSSDDIIFPTVFDTAAALLALRAYNVLSAVNIGAVRSYLESCWRGKGGFLPYSKLEGSLATTYFVIETLSDIGMLDAVNKTSLAEFLKNTYMSGDGFRDFPICLFFGTSSSSGTRFMRMPFDIAIDTGLGSPSVGTALFGIRSYNILLLEFEYRDELMEKIRRCRVTDGELAGGTRKWTFVPADERYVTIYSATMAVLTCVEMDALFDYLYNFTGLLLEYLRTHQNETGAFPESEWIPPVLSSPLISEYFATEIIMTIGVAGGVNLTSLERYVVSCRCQDPLTSALKVLIISTLNSTRAREESFLRESFVKLNASLYYCLSRLRNPDLRDLVELMIVVRALKTLGVLPLVENSSSTALPPEISITVQGNGVISIRGNGTEYVMLNVSVTYNGLLLGDCTVNASIIGYNISSCGMQTAPGKYQVTIPLRNLNAGNYTFLVKVSHPFLPATSSLVTVRVMREETPQTEQNGEVAESNFTTQTNESSTEQEVGNETLHTTEMKREAPSTEQNWEVIEIAVIATPALIIASSSILFKRKLVGVVRRLGVGG
ncbi:MAG: prenyltransferase/squalene oxidase repeat-containing protein [Candidatus Baldrarchaeia archaeon]